ncbi:MAG TPA: FkbM family methyltransferase [Terriglobales bacterium]|nr:FkbM family methyltransferase [Terriglobales bacterium]
MKVTDSDRAGFDPEWSADVAPAMKHLFTFLPDPSLKASAEFRISTRSLPFLADHAFRDMVVLPGSFYIEMALSVHQDVFKRVPAVVRNLTFQNPVILSSEDTIIRIAVRNIGDSTAEYTFYEAATGSAESPSSNPPAAKLEIDCRPPGQREFLDESFSIEAFQAQSHEVVNSDRFYKDLRDNGNQYGPRFRCVSSIWRAGNQSLGKVSWQHSDGEAYSLRPALLDSMTQVLAPFMMAQGRTFVLRSIDRIEIASLNFPATLWCHATLRPQTEGETEGVTGDVRAFDTSGKAQVELSGVRFVLLDRPEPAEASAPLKLAIASNFTVEPIEDVLKFWGAHFNLQTNIEFAPYDQVFQQLLQAEGAFRRNRDGFNVILLQLEKWAAADRTGLSTVGKEKAERYFAKHKRCVLPNGQEIVHLNQYETDYLYKEIFEDESYLKHGIVLGDGATVVDIGANIGMFSLFVTSRSKNPKIYAFEPAPAAYELLKANCEVYGSNAQVFNLGVSDRQGKATFTFYENSSVFSSFHSDEAEDREAIQAVVRNMLSAESVAGESTKDYVNDLTAGRLRRSTHECRLTTVSDIIRENHIDRIDLLKIDAEKSELEIIRGVADCDWPKIDQIVVEIHDPTGDAARRISDLLTGKGYRCALEQEKLLEHSGLFNLFATREAIADRAGPDSERMQSAAALGKSRQTSSLQSNVRDFCDALQSFTSQVAAPLVLCVCPVSPAVEADVELKAMVGHAEQELLSRMGTLAGVSAIGSEVLLRRYPVDEYYDMHGHQLGDIPYTPEGYAAIGTVLFRAIFNLKRKPFKAIVLDCDNTLWEGVCGEDGPRGIAVTEPYRVLQRFMVDQMKAGMLLCLCSKNNEQDVLGVFDQRADMLLKRDHLAAWRINWSTKSENMQALASELNLGLDSFIFIDDNPVECADVEINCPNVLTLRLPQNPASFGSFFEHVWAFDRSGVTEEDRSRLKMYQDNAQRERFRAQTPSLKDFIAGLKVRVEIGEASADQLSRVSQLTFRTNQFNFTTIRRSENEIREFLKQKDAGCLTVRVADRFGDYGVVGVVLYETEPDRLKLDTFLLSCRVLGRGVEYTVLSEVAQRALRARKSFVEITCLPTERNLPAMDFVSSLGDQYRTKPREWLFPAEHLAALQYNPDAKSLQSNEKSETSNVEKPPLPSASDFGITARSAHLQRIGEELWNISRVAKAVDDFRLQTRGLEGVGETETPGTAEAVVANVWRRVLGRPGIGLNANFFEVGGTSLKAVQVIAMLRKELKQNLSVITLFECPTIRLLAARLNPAGERPSAEPRTAGAALRGQQRRARAMRRTKSQ